MLSRVLSEGLWVPASLDVLRRGSSTVLTEPFECLPLFALDAGTRGVVHRAQRGGLFQVAWDDCIDTSEEKNPELRGCLWPVTAALLGLDLTDETGRLHAEWFLADRWGCPRGARLTVLGRGWAIGEGSWGKWILPSPAGGFVPGMLGPRDGPSNILVVPSLAALDPEDNRLLSDGSRWVFAEVLKRLVLHVAGGSTGNKADSDGLAR